MEPSEALKRIEEKHSTGTCRMTVHKEGQPCDVVKLARALDEAAGVLRRHGWPMCAFAAERTLEEVAGG